MSINRSDALSVLGELRDRKIVQWTVAYLAAAWLVLQLVDVMGARWGISDGLARVIDVGLVTGVFVVLVLAWYHGEKGRQWVSGTELLLLAGIAAAGVVVLQLLPPLEDAALADGIGSADGAATGAGAPTADGAAFEPPVDIDEAPWIAVLPWRVPADDPELRELGEGLTGDVIHGIERFSHLLVLSPNTTSHLTGEAVNVREVGEELGARYVIEGSARRSGNDLRISARLVDSRTGTTIWSENFDRSLDDGVTLALQDDVTDRLVATIGDTYGAVARELGTHVDGRPPEDLNPYEAVLRSFLYFQRVSALDHAIARAALERAVEVAPDYAEVWASLAIIYVQEYANEFNPLPGSLDRALTAARRAVTAAPTSPLAHMAFAQTQYFRQDLPAFRAARDRAIELNPLDTRTLALLGILTGYAGDWDHALELTGRAKRLNPDHPGWYEFTAFFHAFHNERSDEALEVASRINMPTYWGDPLARTLAHAQLGNQDAARAAADDLLELWPTFEADYYEHGLINWIFAQPDLVARNMRALRAAGLDMRQGTD